ncbi:MAG: hypothetical protein H6917_18295 [Novosphingobium sp.]|nr:hypothetical protein [Novosphingobium sp.]MCP5404328.1 hypothetical protein [Novosphingobium sp.]
MTEMNAADQANTPMPALASGFDGFRFFLDNNVTYGIGGTGTIFGTGGGARVHVRDVAGTIVFDPSFNSGGHYIGLPGETEDWQVQRHGSTARFSDGDTLVQIPVGTTGSGIGFGGVVGVLRYEVDTDSVKIDDQVVGPEFEPVMPLFNDTFWGNDIIDLSVGGRLFLSPGGEVTVSGYLSIFGTAESEHILLDGGRVVLDPSFNRGGDILTLGLPHYEFSAVVEGSRVKLTGPGYDISIPVGTAGMEVEFSNDSRTLRYDSDIGRVFIGDQIILGEGEDGPVPAASSLSVFG